MVRVHFVNSPNDPLHLTGFATLRKSIAESGPFDTRYWAWADGRSLADAIESDRREHPDARIAIVAWSGASLWAWDAATLLAERGVTIDRVFYLDSNWIKPRVAERGHPQNIGATVLIYRQNNAPPPPPPEGFPRATVYLVPTTQHLAVATHRTTVEVIVKELGVLAAEGAPR